MRSTARQKETDRQRLRKRQNETQKETQRDKQTDRSIRRQWQTDREMKDPIEQCEMKKLQNRFNEQGARHQIIHAIV